MLTSAEQVDWALNQIRIFEQALNALREEIGEANPRLFTVTSKGYEQKLKELYADVVAYLREHPAEAPLHIAARGSGVEGGVMPAKVASDLLEGLQSALTAVGKALRQRGEVSKEIRLRDAFGLNLVATASGSFVFAMDLASHSQPLLFPQYDAGERALEQLVGYVTALDPHRPDRSDVPPDVLAGLRKLTDVLDAGVDEVEIRYSWQTKSYSTALRHETRREILSRLGETGLGPQTIIGTMVGINIECKKCVILRDKGGHVTCAYEEQLEDDLIRALKHRVEVAGETAPAEKAGQVNITLIRRFRRLRHPAAGEDDDEAGS